MTKNLSLQKLRIMGRENLGTVKQFAQAHRETLQTVGIVAAAAATGAVVAVIATKGVILSQALVATKGALATTGTLLPAGALPASGAAGAGSLLHLFNNSLTPLAAGAAGGGAAGWGLTRSGVRKVEEKVNLQAVKTASLQDGLNAVQATVQQVQARLTAPPPAPVEPLPGRVAVVETPTPAAPATRPSTDQLEEIHGIGPVYARRLNDAGIFSFADLAAATPDQVRTIIGPTRSGSMVHPEDWIAEARQRMGVSTATEPPATATLALDRLEAIAGLPPAAARALGGAGILTYAELAALTSERVRELVGESDVSEAEADRWIAQARTLAQPDANP